MASSVSCGCVDDKEVKGIEKITSVRLAEILTERGAVSSEIITDALYTQDRNSEPFAQILLNGGHITEWDLAKIVTENFNLPFLMPGNYQISEVAKHRLPKDVLFEHTIVPLDTFGDIVTVVMPVMLSFDDIAKIQKDHSCDLFPYVGLLSENRKLLSSLFTDYSEWLTEKSERQQNDANQAASSARGTSDSDWMSIFDAGEEAIQRSRRG